MKKLYIWLRRLVVAVLCLGVVVVFVGGALIAVLPTLVQSEGGKSRVASILSSLIGTQLRLDGEVHLEIGRHTTLTVNNVVLLQPTGFDVGEMLSVKRIEIGLSLVPTLLSRLTLDRICVDGLRVETRSASDGTLNLSVVTGSSSSSRAHSGGLSVPAFDSIDIKNVEVRLKHLLHERHIQIRELTVTPDPTHLSQVVTMAGAVDNTPLKVRGILTGVSSAGIAEKIGLELHVEKGQHTVQGKFEFKEGESFSGEVSLRGDDSSTLASPWVTSVPRWAPYSLGGVLSLQLGKTSTLRWSKLHGALEGISISGDGELQFLDDERFGGRSKVAINGSEIHGDVQFDSDGVVTGSIHSQVKDLSRLSPVFLTTLPKFQNFSLQGEFRYRPVPKRESNLEIAVASLSMAESDVKGALSFNFAPFEIRGSLESDRVNVAKVQGAIEQAFPISKVHTEANSEGLFVLPKNFNSDVTWRVNHLTTPWSFNVDRLTFSSSLREGVLLVKPIAASVFGGNAAAEVQVGSGGARVKLDVQELKSARVYEYLGAPPPLEGDFVLGVDLSTVGKDGKEAVRGLKGTMGISSHSAHFKSKLLALSSSGIGKILSPIVSGKTEVPADCMVLDFSVNDGIAASKDHVIKLGDVFLFGRGKINLSSATLDYIFNVNSSNPSMASLIPPFRATGGIQSPYFVPTVSGSIASVFDTAEGVFDSAVGVLRSTSALIFPKTDESLRGLEVCRSAAVIERKRLSSQIGSLLPDVMK